ncbi:MAG TPA: ribulokinase [Propionibacteriaceae bacterium]|nr:ribulokinase [Propionibacteriaceae bacterium]HQE31464.1 ribulokinase [Propionibacteriaceae bacterium]
MDASASYVIGIDFGTLSGRAVVVRVSDGEELGSGVLDYPHAVLEETLPNGDKLPPDWALQVPADYIDVLKTAVPAAVADAGIDPASVVGVGIDFTACTLVPVLEDGTPLNELPEYEGRRHAYIKLWKHHAAQQQADRINALAAERDEWWRPRYGGLLSSEWSMAKGLQLLEEDRELYDRMWRYVEATDWVVWQLGGQFTRNACTAGYKNNWQDGTYPDPEFLAALNPDFAGYFTEKIDGPLVALGSVAGHLTAEAAAWTGLPEGIPIAAGNVDAHVACPAVQAVEPGQMTAIMGTSSCHIVSDKQLHVVPGMCGVVDGGVIDGLYGYEAGQSGVGDIFAWFVKNGVPAAYTEKAKAAGVSVHEYLTDLASQQTIGEHGLVCLDWINGNRSVLVNHELSGLILGLTLTTRPEDIYRALIESTAYGARVIVEAFTSSGVPITELVVVGGLKRNALLMQIYADVLRLPLSIAVSEQGCALGSAIHAAVAAGAYDNVKDASDAMGKKEYAAYTPNEESATAYDALFREYVELHDYFGRGANDVMRRLKKIKREASE